MCQETYQHNDLSAVPAVLYHQRCPKQAGKGLSDRCSPGDLQGNEMYLMSFSISRNWNKNK